MKVSKKAKAEIEKMLIDIQADSYMLGVTSQKQRAENNLELEAQHKFWLKSQQDSMRKLREYLGMITYQWGYYD